MMFVKAWLFVCSFLIGINCLYSQSEPIFIINPKGHINAITGMVFAKSRNQLITSSKDKTVNVWSLDNMELEKTIRWQIGDVYGGEINSIALSDDEKFLAIGGASIDYKKGRNIIPIIDLAKNEQVATIAENSTTCLFTGFFPDKSDFLITCNFLGTNKYKISLWNLGDLSIPNPKTINSPLSGIETDTKWVAVLRQDEILYINGFKLIKWNCQNNSKEVLFSLRDISVSCFSVSESGKYIFIGYTDGLCEIHTQSGKKVYDFSLKGRSLSSDFDAGEMILYISSLDVNNTLCMIDIEDKKETCSHSFGEDYITNILFIGDHRIVKGYANGHISLFDTKDEKTIGKLNSKSEKITALGFDLSNNIAFGNQDLSGTNTNETTWNNFQMSDFPSYFPIIKKFNITDLKIENVDVKETMFSRTFNNHDKYKLSKSEGNIMLNNRVVGKGLAFSFSRDNSDFFTVSGGIKHYDDNLKLLNEYRGASSMYLTMAVASEFIVASGFNHIISLWNIGTTQNLVNFYFTEDDEWICWTPGGYFACSERGDQYIGWQINRGETRKPDFYPASTFFDKFYRPDIIKEILKTGKTDFEVLQSISQAIASRDFNSIPSIKILSPGTDSRGFKTALSYLQSDRQYIEIKVQLTDLGGGIDEILLYQNGKLVETTNRGYKSHIQADDIRIKTYSVTLVDGENKFRITAFNNQRSEAIPAELTIKYQHEQTVKPDLYLFVIGINEYKNVKYNLNYAVADATGFKEMIERGSAAIFNNIKTIFLTNTQAGKPEILSEIGRIESLVRAEDVFIFYYAGHGVMSEEENPQFYIIPFNVTQLYGNNQILQSNGISATELKQISASIKAQKQMFILDACQSGGMVGMLSSRGAAEEKALHQLARSTGTYWLAASNSDQVAGEFDQLGHGLFTYCILQGLTGKADGQNDNKITVQELSSFVNDNVPVLSKQFKGNEQYPNTFGFGTDFPIIVKTSKP